MRARDTQSRRNHGQEAVTPANGTNLPPGLLSISKIKDVTPYARMPPAEPASWLRVRVSFGGHLPALFTEPTDSISVRGAMLLRLSSSMIPSMMSSDFSAV